MAKLAIFKPPELYRKLSKVKYFVTFELRKSISSMGNKKFLLKWLLRSVKIDWIKKSPSINIPFSSKVGTIMLRYISFPNCIISKWQKNEIFPKWHKFQVIIAIQTFLSFSNSNILPGTKTCKQDLELIASKQILSDKFVGKLTTRSLLWSC